MINSYFNNDILLIPGTKARAEDVNDRFSSVATGFGLLPTSHPLLKGFSDPVAVGVPTNASHAISAGDAIKGAFTFGSDTGIANAYVINLPLAPAAYTAGMGFYFKALNSSTGPSTININGLGIKQLVRSNGAQVFADDILAGSIIPVFYDGTKFLGPPAFPGQYDDLASLMNDVAAQVVYAEAQATLASAEADRADLEADRAATEAAAAAAAVTASLIAAVATEANRAETEADRSFTEANRAETEADRAATEAVPPGCLIFSASETPPPQTLATNGASYLRSAYPALFAAIGVMYGPGSDPGNTFQTPDYRGYHFRSTAGGSSIDPDRASRTNRGDGTVGDAVGTKQTDAVRNHVHSSQSWTGTASIAIGALNMNYLIHSATGLATGNPTTGGSAESRPKNVNVNVFMRY